MYVTESLAQAEARYIPQPYAGTLTLFHGEEAMEFGPNLGWDGLAEQFQRCVIGDGNLDTRRDILNEPLVAITAEKLVNYLKEAEGARLPAAAPRTI